MNDTNFENRYEFNYNEKFQNEEINQISCYYNLIVKEFEDIIRYHNKLIYFLLIVACFLLNFYTMLVHVSYKFAGNSSRIVQIMVQILCFLPDDPKIVEDDLIFIQILIVWFFIDLAIYIGYFSKEEKLISTPSANLAAKCIHCLNVRFELYLYEAPKYGASLLSVKSINYIKAKKEFEAELGNFTSFSRKVTISLTAEQVKSDSSSSGSNEDSGGNDSKDEITEENDEITILHLSELTDLQSKVLYIYANKNKYFFGRMIRSAMFNVPRLSVCFMAVNLIYSESYLDLLLLAVCLFYSLKRCEVFYFGNFFLPICFAIYFVVNWMVLHFPRFEYEPYQKFVSILLPKASTLNSTPRYTLLLGIGVYNLGYATMFYWINYTCFKLLTLETKIGNTFHISTMDKYLVIDYKRWKKGPLNIMNFIFKMVHTIILEIFSLSVFMVSFFIEGHTYFKTPIIITIFLLVISEGVQSLKLLAKTLLENTSNKNDSKQFIALCARVIQFLCWGAIIIESLEIFKKFNIISADDRPSIGVVIIYYLTVTVSDLVNSEEYERNRKQIKNEEIIKTTYTSLNMTYKTNEDKLFSRVNSFIGKEKLENMAKSCVLHKDFEDIKLFMDYNNKPLLNILNDLYRELQESYLKGFRLIMHRILHNTYNFLDNNINHHRYQDLFVLYRTVVRRNQKIINYSPLNLKLYFSFDYRQFENTLKETKIFFQLYKERDQFKLDKYKENMELFRNQVKLNQRYIEEGKTFKQLSVYEWVDVSGKDADHTVDENQGKPIVKLLEKAGKLYSLITRSNGMKGGGHVNFENLKVELSKKGYVICNFGNMDIVLYNMKQDILADTQSYIIFKPLLILTMAGKCIMSNIEISASLVICIIATLNGGLINMLILGILLFVILVEENYGYLQWWKTMYMIYLIKILLNLIDPKDNTFLSFMLGNYRWTDFLQIIIINIVVFQVRKTGFSEEHMFNVEDMGTAVIRLIVNQDFDNFIDRMTEMAKKKIEILVSHLDNKFKDSMSQEIYRHLKTKCTYTVVKVYLNIENYKLLGKTSAMRLFHRLKEDCFTNTQENGSSFFWRNFSTFARRPGQDFSPHIYTTLAIIIVFSISLLQYNETGKHMILHFFSGTQAISSQTVITILMYIILLFTEKYFNSLRSIDSVGARYESISVSFYKNFSVKTESNELERKKNHLERWRRAVRRLMTILKMKAKQSTKINYESNPLYIKFYVMIFVWICINLIVFLVQPIMAHSNRNGLFEKDLSAFKCSPESPDCFNYHNLTISKLFYFLNIIYMFLCVQQIRKAKQLSMPIEKNYTKITNLVAYYAYYKPPILREICTLIEYASQATTLEITDWLLCEDLKEYMIKAKISHSTNEMKNTGTLVERNSRVLVSVSVLTALVGLIIMPLLLFSKFTSGAKEQEIVSGSIKMTLYAGTDRFLTTLYTTKIMTENRKLNDQEKSTLQASSSTSIINRDRMRVVGFSAYSDTYLDTEETSKTYYIQHLLKSTEPFVEIVFEFKTEDGIFYNKTYKILMVESMKDNIMNVVFSKCSEADSQETSELFLRMIPKVSLFDSDNRVQEQNDRGKGRRADLHTEVRAQPKMRQER